jgi:hypothetical protein
MDTDSDKVQKENTFQIQATFLEGLQVLLHKPY